MHVREQRVQFVVAALRREQSLTALCEQFHISRPTCRSWLGATGNKALRASPSVAAVRSTAHFSPLAELEEPVV